MVTATELQLVVDKTDELILENPFLEDSSIDSLIEKNSWWLKPVFKMENHGYGNITPEEHLNTFGFFTVSPEQERYSELLKKKRMIDKINLVQEHIDADSDYNLDTLLTDNFPNVLETLNWLTEEHGLKNYMNWDLTVILPKELSKLNYPFINSRLHFYKLPPTPDSLRICIDSRFHVFKPKISKKR